jgi:hypothetical protein
MPNFDKVKIDNDLRELNKKYKDAKDKIYQKGGSGYRMKQYKTGSSQYKQAKVLFDQEIKEFRKLEAELNPKIAELENKLKELETKKTEEKEKSTYKSTVEKLKDEVQRAKDAQDTKAIAAAEAKLKAEYAAKKAKDAKASGTESKTGAQFQLSDEENVANLLSSANVSMGPSGPIVQVTEPNKIDPTTGKPTVYQGYLYLTTTDGGKGEKAIFFGTSDVIRDRYQKQLIKNYGSKQAVIDKLYKAGYLRTNKEVPTSAYLAALDSAAGEYTVAQVNAYKQEGLKEFPTMDEFLAAKKGSGLGGTKTKTNITEYSDSDLKKIINAISQDFNGRDANSQEIKKLIPVINQKLKKNPDLISTTTDAEGNVVATKTKTGLNVEQFLIDEISQKDEAKANQVLGYYNVFKQSVGGS